MSDPTKETRFLIPISIEVPEGWSALLVDGKRLVLERIPDADFRTSRQIISPAALRFAHQNTGNVALKLAAEEIERLQRETIAPPRTLGLGDEVTYTPAYATQFPRDGWKIEKVPIPVYGIKHTNGRRLGVSREEICAVESTARPKGI